MLVREYLEGVASMPFAPIDDIIGPGTLVVLAPHPDDETLGCGGLIAGARALGRRVEVVVITDGSGSHPGSRTHPPARLAALRRAESRCAAEALGLSSAHVTHLDLPDAAPPTGAVLAEALDAIESVLRACGAKTLCVTWRHDPHCDHQAAAAMADAMAARLPDLHVWHYPIWGLLLLPPDQVIDASGPVGYRLDIAPWLEAKRAAIRCHVSQMTTLIDDSPDGFQFDDRTLAPFLQPFERFIEASR